VAGVTEGLRERKKRQTRETIVRTAMELFAAHGFDTVTVADVSEKTVFNYFPAKEDLVFSAGMGRTERLLAAVRERDHDGSIVEPFRRFTDEYLDRVEHEPVEAVVAIPRLVMASEALRNRLFLGWEREAMLLAPVIAAEGGRADDDLLPAIVARTLAWTHRLIFRSAFTRLLAGEDQRTVAAELREEARRAYDLLEGGLADYGPRTGP
jgi:AcrR family transcriptional regulator